MPENARYFDATQENFELEVLQASIKTPVLVDFWAPWCGPCQSLGPLLEKVVESFKGAVKLAKVDTDRQMQLTGAFRIKSLPTVVLIKNGQLVDGFMGALPESAIREFLSRHLSEVAPENGPENTAIGPAELPEQAIARLRTAIATAPDKPELKLDLAEMLILARETDEVAAILQGLPANLSNDSRAKRLFSRLEFMQALEGAPDTSVLLMRVEKNANDFEAQDLLGLRCILEGKTTAGLDAFLYILRTQRSWREGQAKQRLLAAFNLIEDEALVSQYRRKMASVLF